MPKKTHQKSSDSSAVFILLNGPKIGGAYKRYYVLFNTINIDEERTMLVAEQVHVYYDTFISTFYYETIALVTLDENGEIVWSKKIAKDNSKNQVPIYSHYFAARRDDRLYLLYNGNEKSINHVKGEVQNAFTFGGAFISAKVLPDGNIEEKVLIRESDLEGVRIRPGLCRWLSDNTLLVFAQDPSNVRNQRFIKLTFPESSKH